MQKMSYFESIQLIIYDFDGVMTDNTAYVSQDGTESVRVHRGDGLAVSLFRAAGLKQVIVSTETNPVVSQRGVKLKLPVFQGIGNKKETVLAIAKDYDLPLSALAYIGNDLNDFEAMMLVGLRICPADAEAEIKDISHITTTAKGGEGVIRELYRLSGLK